MLCYDGITGDLLKAELRNGTMYCSNEADEFMRSLLDEFIADFPDMPRYLRGDSGFASPKLYDVCEENCKYAIRLKENATLRKLAEMKDQALYRATKYNQVDYAVVYGEFEYIRLVPGAIQKGGFQDRKSQMVEWFTCTHSSLRH